jgi:hypothetical protein
LAQQNKTSQRAHGEGENQTMKRIALFTFILLMAAGLYAQTVKPMPPIVGSYPEGSSTTEVTTASQPLYFLTPDPPCGYGGGVQQDNKGACSLTIILHNGPPEAVCVLGYDDTLHAPVVTCTWKPKEKP